MSTGIQRPPAHLCADKLDLLTGRSYAIDMGTSQNTEYVVIYLLKDLPQGFS